MVLRIIATIIIVALWSLFYTLITGAAPILSGYAAGLQFQNSDTAAMMSTTATHYIGNSVMVPSCLAIVALLIVWVPYIERFLLMATLLLFGLGAAPAYAYYDKSDYAEAYTILPNESAFWVPDIGANKDSQGQFDSESYLAANKLAVKRFLVPHTKLQGSGSFFDFYVPAGRLIIVDRTPFSREWVAGNRGTSTRDESFPCQSKEGLDVSVGVSIGASVLEISAAKYLYRFGVLAPVGDRGDPRTIFTSVYYSRKLSDVMDDVGRKLVQTVVCKEISSRTFDKANEEANLIMENVKKAGSDYFATVGITLDFIGWADTFTFSKDVQAAVNRKYIATVDAANASMLAPYAQTIQLLAAADALRSFGEHTDGKLPTTIVGLPPEMGGLLSTLLKSAPAH